MKNNKELTKSDKTFKDILNFDNLTDEDKVRLDTLVTFLTDSYQVEGNELSKQIILNLFRYHLDSINNIYASLQEEATPLVQIIMSLLNHPEKLKKLISKIPPDTAKSLAKMLDE